MGERTLRWGRVLWRRGKDSLQEGRSFFRIFSQNRTVRWRLRGPGVLWGEWGWFSGEVPGPSFGTNTSLSGVGTRGTWVSVRVSTGFRTDRRPSWVRPSLPDPGLPPRRRGVGLTLALEGDPPLRPPADSSSSSAPSSSAPSSFSPSFVFSSLSIFVRQTCCCGGY